jgi:RimJ/RimL family protein N-acetyltransferase
VLKPFDERYGGALQEYLADPEVVRYLPTIRNLMSADIHSWLQYARSDKRECVWAIFSRRNAGEEVEEHKFIGVSFLRLFDGYLDGLGGTIIGDRHAWGSGIGLEVKTLQLRFAFQVIELSRVFASIQTGNERARRLLARSGYERENALPIYMHIAHVGPPRQVYSITRRKWLLLQHQCSH